MSNASLDHVVVNFSQTCAIYNDTVTHDHNVVITHVSIDIEENPSCRMRTLSSRLSASSRPFVSDPNGMLNYFKDSITEAFQEFSTTKLVWRKSAKSCLPWMNDHLESLLKTQLNLFRKAKSRLHYHALKCKLKGLKKEKNCYVVILHLTNGLRSPQVVLNKNIKTASGKLRRFVYDCKYTAGFLQIDRCI